jgi:Rrf2 family protein
MLSTTSEYALRALSCLTRFPRDRHVLGRELARAAGIPTNYLSKLLVALGQAGILEAARGPRGGYRFRRSPRGIALAEIVEVFEGVRSRRNCLFGGGRECSEETACPVHDRWRTVRAAFVDFLETTTLDEIAPARNGPTPSRAREGP